MHQKRSELQAELAQLNTAVSAGEAELATMEEEVNKNLTALQKCREEQQGILGGMDANMRAMIELGRQLERGCQ